MIPPPNLDDPVRIAALRRLEILDGSPDPAYDRVVRLATTLCHAPMALVTLVDRDRQWFKARTGVDLVETDSEISFCGHALAAPDGGLLVVDDTSSDPRFADNPLVTGRPNIGAYAGQAIHDPSGVPIGALCVIDSSPHHWSSVEVEALVGLATIVDELIVKHGPPESGDIAPDAFGDLMLATVHDGVVIQDVDGRIIRWNRAAEVALGLTSEQLAGRTSLDPRWRAIRSDGSTWPGEIHPAMQALHTGQAVLRQTMGIDRPGDGLVWLRVNSTPMLKHGVVTGALTTFVDLTTLSGETLPTAQPTNLTMTDREHLLAALERVTETIERTTATLTLEAAITESTMNRLRDGSTPLAAMSAIDVREGSVQVSHALTALEEARRLSREAMFRALLDDGSTIAELAEMWGVSKQLVYRICSKPAPERDPAAL